MQLPNEQTEHEYPYKRLKQYLNKLSLMLTVAKKLHYMLRAYWIKQIYMYIIYKSLKDSIKNNNNNILAQAKVWWHIAELS